MRNLFVSCLAVWAMMLLTVCEAQQVQAQEVQANSSAKLHSKDTVLYYQLANSEKVNVAWEKTAAYEALKNSGLLEVAAEIKGYAKTKGFNNAQIEKAAAFITHVQKNGLSLSVAIPEQHGVPLPRTTLILPGAGKWFKELPPLVKLLNNEFRDLEFREIEREDRKILLAILPKTPGVEIGIWQEGEHLVFHAGIDAVNLGLEVAVGDAANLTENATYQKLSREKSEFVVSQNAWLNVQAVRKVYGKMELGGRQKLTVADFIKLTDLDKIDLIRNVSGYQGKSLWSETSLLCPNGRPFWLAPGSGKMVKLSDLPVLPKELPLLLVSNFSLSHFMESVLKKVKDADELADQRLFEDWEDFRNIFKRKLGIDLKADLIDTFGETVCVYYDKNGGILPVGIAIQLKSSTTLQQSVKSFSEKMAKERHAPFSVRMSQIQGRDLAVFRFATSGFRGPQMPLLNVGIGKKWAVFGLTPQVASAFFLRQDGKLQGWKPSDEVQAGLNELPKEFSSLSVIDMRMSYQLILAYAQMGGIAMETGMNEAFGMFREVKESFPVRPERLGTIEMVTAPLFPNITVSTIDRSSVKWTSRRSAYDMLFGAPDVESTVAMAALAVKFAPLIEELKRKEEEVRRERRNRFRPRPPQFGNDPRFGRPRMIPEALPVEKIPEKIKKKPGREKTEEEKQMEAEIEKILREIQNKNR